TLVIFIETDFLTIHINNHEVGSSFEMKEDTSPIPIFGDGECMTIATNCRIVPVDMRWTCPKTKSNIHIHWTTIPIKFPIARNRHLNPVLIIKILVEKAGRYFSHPRNPMEFPVSIYGFKIG